VNKEEHNEYNKQYYRKTHRTWSRVNCSKKDVEELRTFIKENDIELLELLRYMRRRNDKKMQKGGK